MAKNTREKLLDAAFTLFAEKGYRSTTIQDIANKAGTNVAAINYHFQSKANFYAEVIISGMQAEKFGPPDMRPTPENAADLLREFIYFQVKDMRNNAIRTLISRVRAQEMVEPSPVLEIVCEKLVRPMISRIEEIVRILLPDPIDQSTVRRHTLNIVACLQFYTHEERFLENVYPDVVMDEEELSLTCEHIFRTIMAGLGAEGSNPREDSHVSP